MRKRKWRQWTAYIDHIKKATTDNADNPQLMAITKDLVDILEAVRKCQRLEDSGRHHDAQVFLEGIEGQADNLGHLITVYLGHLEEANLERPRYTVHQYEVGKLPE